MKIYLDDSHCREQLYPFTYTRHVADIRVGILTIREKWEQLVGDNVSTILEPSDPAQLHIPANIIPSLQNFRIVIQAAKDKLTILEGNEIRKLSHPWHIFQFNDWAIQRDFELVTRNRESQPISDTNRCINPENIFIEAGAIVEYSILNASTGPIYISAEAIVMEGNMVRGPFCLGEKSILKMGSKIYGATTIGPHCVAGGEIKNSVLMGYCNKAHDGYLGDSVIGEWCNLGAGTSNSNVKNTGTDVQYYIDDSMQPLNAGNKAGLLMGDYSRAAINTSFNTGTVIGVCCNIFGQSQPEKFVPNFSWGTERYELDKAFRDIENWKKMKNQLLLKPEKDQLQQLYILTK